MALQFYQLFSRHILEFSFACDSFLVEWMGLEASIQVRFPREFLRQLSLNLTDSFLEVLLAGFVMLKILQCFVLINCMLR